VSIHKTLHCQWDRYILCDGSPDPTIPGEINTYINLWREDSLNNDIQSVLRDSGLTLRVCVSLSIPAGNCMNFHQLLAELQHLLETTPNDELSVKEADQYREVNMQTQLISEA
jgi:cancer susceptibility candidate protein 1